MEGRFEMIPAKLKRLINELIVESQRCSNCCFNVSRNKLYHMHNDVRESLASAAAAHDVAVHLLKEELKNH